MCAQYFKCHRVKVKHLRFWFHRIVLILHTVNMRYLYTHYVASFFFSRFVPLIICLVFSFMACEPYQKEHFYFLFQYLRSICFHNSSVFSIWFRWFVELDLFFSILFVSFSPGNFFFSPAICGVCVCVSPSQLFILIPANERFIYVLTIWGTDL